MEAKLEDKYYSVQEVTESLEHLDGLTLAQLYAIAATFAASTPALTADDLLQEAFTLTLEGHRRWPKNVGAPKYFYMTIKSIRDNHFKSVSRKDAHAVTVLESDFPSAGDDFDEDRSGVLEAAVDMSVDPAGLAQAEALEDRIQEAFSDDEEGMLVLEAMIEGLSGKETMELLGLDKKEYGTANRRTRRKLQRILGGI